MLFNEVGVHYTPMTLAVPHDSDDASTSSAFFPGRIPVRPRASGGKVGVVRFVIPMKPPVDLYYMDLKSPLDTM